MSGTLKVVWENQLGANNIKLVNWEIMKKQQLLYQTKTQMNRT